MEEVKPLVGYPFIELRKPGSCLESVVASFNFSAQSSVNEF